MFNRKLFEAALAAVSSAYMTSAPTVDQWCDMLAAAKDHEVTLADVHLLSQFLKALHTPEQVQANHAANMVYHLNQRLGRDTTGQAGF